MIIPTTPVSGLRTQSKGQRQQEPNTGGDQRFAKALSDLVSKPSSRQQNPSADRYDRSETDSDPRSDRLDHSADNDRSSAPADRTRPSTQGEQQRAENTEGDEANDHREGVNHRSEDPTSGGDRRQDQIDGDRPVSNGQTPEKDAPGDQDTSPDAQVDTAASTAGDVADNKATDESDPSDPSTVPTTRDIDGAAATMGLVVPAVSEATVETSDLQTEAAPQPGTVNPTPVDISDLSNNTGAGGPLTTGQVPASAETDSDNTISSSPMATADNPTPADEITTAIETAETGAVGTMADRPAEEPVNLSTQTSGDGSSSPASIVAGTGSVEQAPADDDRSSEIETDESSQALSPEGDGPAIAAVADTTTSIGQAVAASAAAKPDQPDRSSTDSDSTDAGLATAVTATTPRTEPQAITAQGDPSETDQQASDDTGQLADLAPGDADPGPEPAGETVKDADQSAGPLRATTQAPPNLDSIGQPAQAQRSTQGSTTSAPNPLPDPLVELAGTGLAERLRPAFSAIHRSIDGMDELKLRIQEQGGAPIKVSISTSEETVRVVLSSTNNNLMSELGQGRQKLADDLRRAGFTQTSIDVQSDGPNQNNDSRRPTQTSRIDNRFDYDEAYDTDRSLRVSATTTRASRAAGVDLDL